MCAQYKIILEKENLEGLVDLGEKKIESRILPYQLAPVLICTQDKIELRWMNFSLVPKWSKEKRVKFATHNARIETVLEKPAWREPFLNTRCIVPITQFIEPIYTGVMAQNMVAFSAPQTLFAAGIYTTWQDPLGGAELFSFAILTKEPDIFVAQTGHDRTPIFLQPSAIKNWLQPTKRNGQELLAFIAQNIATPNWKVQIDRPLKSRIESTKEEPRQFKLF